MKSALRLFLAPTVLLVALVLLSTFLRDTQLPQTDLAHGIEHNWRYIHSDAFGHFDHELYYYNIGQIMDSVRQADVLLLGTSRTLFAYDGDTLDAHSQQTGQRTYNLAFPFRESMRFPLQLIRRYDIRNKVVLVEADDAFFVDGLGRYASAVEGRGLVSSLARIWYNTAKYRLIQAVDRLARAATGRFVVADWSFNEHVLYRSARTGAWFTEYFPTNAESFHVDGVVTEQGEQRMLSPAVVAGARELVSALRERNCEVYFVSVPYPKAPAPELVRELAEVAGAHWLDTSAVSNGELFTRDGEHLTLACARRFTTSVLNALQVNVPR